MGIHQNKYRFVVWYMLGFLIGILYANIIARNYITMTGIFHQYFLNQYTQIEIVAEDYLWYLFRRRLLPVAVLAIAGNAGLKKTAAVACLIWTGFAAGILSVAAVLRMGVKGIFLCLAGMFPQYIFYIFAYAILLYYFFQYPRVKWSGKKTVLVAGMMLTGILLEAYINPAVMRGAMKVML